MVYIEFGTTRGVRHPLGVLEWIPPHKGGLLYVFAWTHMFVSLWCASASGMLAFLYV